MNIGEAVRVLRRRRGMNTTELAARIGVTNASISRKERGLSPFYPEEIESIVEALGLMPDELSRMIGAETPTPRGIPVINLAPAGHVADYDHDQGGLAEYHDAWQYIDRGLIGDADAFAVQVVGDSMEPSIREGDICVFSPVVEGKVSRQPRPGCIVFVRFSADYRAGCLLARWNQLEDGQWLLSKDNRAYPPRQIRPEWVDRMAVMLEHRRRWT